jgi:formylglycine-generating enzyme required for sulfatase activity
LVYPWGNEFVADNLVYGGNSNNQTATVGSRPKGKSWIGALDISGNVWEWTSSLYMNYPYDENDGREADADNRTDVLRVLRGGSDDIAVSNVRAANRSRYYPKLEDGFLGFRCARSS